MTQSETLAETRWVVKIGSSVLTNDGKGLDYAALNRWIDEIAELHRTGMEIVVVSSGAVAEGMSRLGWWKKPGNIGVLQAAAAVGQMGLMQAYEASFFRHSMRSAQILLTHEDFATRQRYLNVQATLRKLAEMRTVPVINENDTVCTEEIRCGDNDMLAALVANMICADRLVILTDQFGLLSADPRTTPYAELVSRASTDDDRLFDFAGGASAPGRGGMQSKVKAARIFALSGGITTIASGRLEGVLGRIRTGAEIGTELRPGQMRLPEAGRWLAGQLKTKGTLILDKDTAHAVTQNHCGILSDGVVKAHGNFDRNDVIRITDPHERSIAIGISSLSAPEIKQMTETRRVVAHESTMIPYPKELVAPENIVLDIYRWRTCL